MTIILLGGHGDGKRLEVTSWYPPVTKWLYPLPANDCFLVNPDTAISASDVVIPYQEYVFSYYGDGNRAFFVPASRCS